MYSQKLVLEIFIDYFYTTCPNILFFPFSEKLPEESKKKILSLTEYKQKKTQPLAEPLPVVSQAISGPAVLVEVERLGQLLEACSDEDVAGALANLEALARIPMRLAILQACTVGLTVNTLRKKSANSAVVDAATALVKRWKKLVIGAPTGGTGQKNVETKEKENKGGKGCLTTETDASTTKNVKKADLPCAEEAKKKDDDVACDAGVKEDVGEAVREHCRSLLAAALEANTSLSASCRMPSQQLARDIEEEIFKLFKETNQKYRSQVYADN